MSLTLEIPNLLYLFVGLEIPETLSTQISPAENNSFLITQGKELFHLHESQFERIWKALSKTGIFYERNPLLSLEIPEGFLEVWLSVDGYLFIIHFDENKEDFRQIFLRSQDYKKLWDFARKDHSCTS